MRETCKKEDIKAFLTLKIKKYYTLWKMADSFVKNISALFLQGFEIGFKKTLERGKYMKKENGVTKQVGKKLNFWQKTKLLAETLEVPCTDTDVCPGNDFFLCI